MKSKNVEEIVSKENMIVSQPGLSFRPFVPTVDGDIINMEPTQLLSRVLNKFKDIPILLGTNADEGSKSAMNFLPNFFPNYDIDKPQLKEEEYDEIIGKVFSKYPKGVSGNMFLYGIFVVPK